MKKLSINDAEKMKKMVNAQIQLSTHIHSIGNREMATNIQYAEAGSTVYAKAGSAVYAEDGNEIITLKRNSQSAVFTYD